MMNVAGVTFTILENGREREASATELDVGSILKAENGYEKLNLEEVTFDSLPEKSHFRHPGLRRWYAKVRERDGWVGKPLRHNRPFGEIMYERGSVALRPSQTVEKLSFVPVEAKAA